ncbi:serine-rich adhesin for platelets-like isoform X2 [Anguilla anguilla]|uniref:serine-rich adhesin for platelets-like isoform X2 n=1 Tax=Anguilla anguilla TaxID=7936 RepID=UPI0015ABCD69|nr:serine-rich adhesin for platelets-like isoform X2 [Anguilla anguilla]
MEPAITTGDLSESSSTIDKTMLPTSPTFSSTAGVEETYSHAPKTTPSEYTALPIIKATIDTSAELLTKEPSSSITATTLETAETTSQSEPMTTVDFSNAVQESTALSSMPTDPPDTSAQFSMSTQAMTETQRETRTETDFSTIKTTDIDSTAVNDPSSSMQTLISQASATLSVTSDVGKSTETSEGRTSAQSDINNTDLPAIISTAEPSISTSFSSTSSNSYITRGESTSFSTAETINMEPAITTGDLSESSSTIDKTMLPTSPTFSSTAGVEETYSHAPKTTPSEYTALPIIKATIDTSAELLTKEPSSSITATTLETAETTSQSEPMTTVDFSNAVQESTALSSMPTDPPDTSAQFSMSTQAMTETQRETRTETDFSTIKTTDIDSTAVNDPSSSMQTLISQASATLSVTSDVGKSTETSEGRTSAQSDINNTDHPAIISTAEPSQSTTFSSTSSNSYITTGESTSFSTAETINMEPAITTGDLSESSSTIDKTMLPTSPTFSSTAGVEETYSHAPKTTPSDYTALPIQKATTDTSAELLTKEPSSSMTATTLETAETTSQSEPMTTVDFSNAMQESTALSSMPTDPPDTSAQFSMSSQAMTETQRETRTETDFSTIKTTDIDSTAVNDPSSSMQTLISQASATLSVTSDVGKSTETSEGRTSAQSDINNTDLPAIISTAEPSQSTSFSSTSSNSYITTGESTSFSTAETINMEPAITTGDLSESSSTIDKTMLPTSPTFSSTAGVEETYSHASKTTPSEYTALPIIKATIDTSAELLTKEPSSSITATTLETAETTSQSEPMTTVDFSNAMQESTALSSMPTDPPDTSAQFSMSSQAMTETQRETRTETDFSTIKTTDIDSTAVNDPSSSMQTLISQASATLSVTSDVGKSTETSEGRTSAQSDINNTDLPAIISTAEPSQSTSFSSTSSNSYITTGESTSFSTAETINMEPAITTGDLSESSSTIDKTMLPTSPTFSSTAGVEETYSHAPKTTPSDYTALPILKATTDTSAELLTKEPSSSITATTLETAETTSQSEPMTTVDFSNAVQESTALSSMPTDPPDTSAQFSMSSQAMTETQRETRTETDFSTIKTTDIDSTAVNDPSSSMQTLISQASATLSVTSDVGKSTETSEGRTSAQSDINNTDLPAIISTAEPSQSTSFSSTSSNSYITRGESTSFSTAETINMEPAITTGDLSESSSTIDKTMLPTSPTFSSTAGVEETYSHAPKTTPSEYTALPIIKATIDTSAELLTKEPSSSITATTLETAETTSQSEPMTTVDFSNAVQESTALSSMPTDPPDTSAQFSMSTQAMTETQRETRTETDFSTIKTTDIDSTAVNDPSSSMQTLISQASATLSVTSDVGKSTETSEGRTSAQSDINNTDHPAIISTAEPSQSTTFSSTSSNSYITTGESTSFSTAETINMEPAITTGDLSESSSTIDKTMLPTSPTFSSTAGVEETYSHAPKTTPSDYTALPIQKATTDTSAELLTKEPSSSITATTLETAETTSQSEPMTTVDFSNAVQESTALSSMPTDPPDTSAQFSMSSQAMTETQRETRTETDFSTIKTTDIDSTAVNDPSSSMQTLISQASATLSVTSDVGKSTETSEGRSSAQSDINNTDLPAIISTAEPSQSTSFSSTSSNSYITTGESTSFSTAETINMEPAITTGDLSESSSTIDKTMLPTSPTFSSTAGVEETYSHAPKTTPSDYTALPIQKATTDTSAELLTKEPSSSITATTLETAETTSQSEPMTTVDFSNAVQESTALSSMPTDPPDTSAQFSMSTQAMTETQRETRTETDFSTIKTTDIDSTAVNDPSSSMQTLISQASATLSVTSDVGKSTETSEGRTSAQSDINNTDLPAIISTAEPSQSTSFSSTSSNSYITTGESTSFSTAETINMEPAITTGDLSESSSTIDKTMLPTSPTFSSTAGVEETYSHAPKTTPSDYTALPIQKATTDTSAELLTKEPSSSITATTLETAETTSQSEPMTTVDFSNAVQESTALSSMPTDPPDTSAQFSMSTQAMTETQRETRTETDFSTIKTTDIDSTSVNDPSSSMQTLISQASATLSVTSDVGKSTETSEGRTSAQSDINNTDLPAIISTAEPSQSTTFSSTSSNSYITTGESTSFSTAETINMEPAITTGDLSESSSTIDKTMLPTSPTFSSTAGVEETYSHAPTTTPSDYTALPILKATTDTSAELLTKEPSSSLTATTLETAETTSQSEPMTTVDFSNAVQESTALSSMPTDQPDTSAQFSMSTQAMTEKQRETRTETDFSTIKTTDINSTAVNDPSSSMQTLISQASATLSVTSDVGKSTETSEGRTSAQSDINNTDLPAIISTAEPSQSTSFSSTSSNSYITTGESTSFSTAETINMEPAITTGDSSESSSTIDKTMLPTSPTFSSTAGVEETYSHAPKTTPSDYTALPILKATTDTSAELLTKEPSSSITATTLETAETTSHSKPITTADFSNAVQESTALSSLPTDPSDSSAQFSMSTQAMTETQRETRTKTDFSTIKTTDIDSTAVNDPSSSMQTLISQASATLSVTSDVGKSTETSEGTTSAQSDVNNTDKISTAEPSQSTSFSSTSSNGYIRTGESTSFSTAETINMVPSITTGDLSESSSTIDKTMLPTSPTFSSTAGVEETYSHAPKTTPSEYTALPIIKATIDTSAELLTKEPSSSITATTLETAETISQSEPMTTVDFSNAVQESIALSSMPTDPPDTIAQLSMSTQAMTEKQRETKIETDFSTIKTTYIDSTSISKYPSTMKTLISQPSSTFAVTSDVGKSTETSKTTSTQSDTNNTDLPATISTAEPSRSTSFSSTSSTIYITTGGSLSFSTEEFANMESSVTTSDFSESSSPIDMTILPTSPTSSSTGGRETTHRHAATTIASDYTALSTDTSIKFTTKKSSFSMPTTGVETEETPSQTGPQTSIAVSITVQESTALSSMRTDPFDQSMQYSTFNPAMTDAQTETSITTDFSTIETTELDSTSISNPLLSMPTFIFQSTATIAVSTDVEKSTETSDGTISTLSDILITKASDLQPPSDSTMLPTSLPASTTTAVETASSLALTTTLSNETARTKVTATSEIFHTAETTYMLPSVTTEDIPSQFATVETTSQREPMISLTSSITMKPSTPIVSTTSVLSTPQLNINEPQTTKWPSTTPQATKNSTSQFTLLETEKTLNSSHFTSPAEITFSSGDFTVNSHSTSTFPMSASSQTSAHSEVNFTKQPTLTSASTRANFVPSTDQNLKATVISSASSSSYTTKGMPVSSSKTNKPSATTVGALTTIFRTVSSTSLSKTTPAVTTKGTTGTSSTSARVTTKKTTVASTTLCEGSRVTHIRIEGLDSKEISVSWNGDNLRPEMKYVVKLKQGPNTSEVTNVSTVKKAQFTDLLPGVTYTVTIEYFSCSNKEEIKRNITTAANIYESSTRIPDIEFLPEYDNHSSPQFQTLVSHFKEEITKNLPRDYQDLIKENNMRVVVTKIRRGSVIIEFDLLTNTKIDLQTSTVEKNIINALNTSTLKVDLDQTTVREADACQRSSDLCSENGICTKVGPSYTCKCKAEFVDQNPSLPGTDCQKQALITISPTSRQTTSGKDNCEGVCSSLAECTAIHSGTYGCQCYAGLIDVNPSNPGKLCREPFDCFREETNLCSPSNTCLRPQSVCSRKNLFKATVELKSWLYSPALYNTESQDWISVSTNFTITVINKMRTLLLDESFDLTVVGFKKGSVVVQMVFGFNGGSHLNVPTLETALQDVVRANLDKLAVVTLEELPAEENSGEGWRVATIVTGVLLGAALLLIVFAGLAFALRRRLNCSNSYKLRKTNDNGDPVLVSTFGNYICQDV